MCQLLVVRLLLDLVFFSRPLRWMQSFNFNLLLMLLLLAESCDRLDDVNCCFQTDTLRLLSCILCSKVAVFLRSELRVEFWIASDQFLDEMSMFFSCRAYIFPVFWLIIASIPTQRLQAIPPYLPCIQSYALCENGWRQVLFRFNCYYWMGPSPSQNKAQSQPQSEVLIINHSRFNNLKVVSLPSEDDEGAIEIIIPLPNEIEFKKWQGRIAQLPQSENIFLPIKQRFEKTEFCGSGGVSTITYKYYPYLLKDEVVNRCNMEGKFFEESELWYLVYSIILAAESFHSRGEKVGDVRPQNVFISPEGQVRVATQYTWPGEQTNYMKTVFEKEVTYLSPEELKDISYGKLEESANFALNESFSIGLTCLDAATLTDSSAFYEANNKFKYEKLEDRLADLQKNDSYSAPLVLLIKGLCQAEPTKRITCKELVEWLSPYENSIVELAEFTVNEVPEKLHRLQEKPKPSKPQPLQYQTQNQPPISYVPPSYLSGPANQPPQVIRQVYPNFPNEHFTNQTYINGNQINLPRPLSYEPQPIVFQSQSNQRSTYAQNPVGTQVRGANINFQQIDEQLQMSRKLFPS